MSKKKQLNIYGKSLENCSNNPLTGYFRDGCCNSSETDFGQHTICSIVTDDFLEYSN